MTPGQCAHHIRRIPHHLERPFSVAVEHANIVYISGQVGIDHHTGKVDSDFQAQAKQTLHNMQKILDKAGSGLDRVLKVTVFLTPDADAKVFNEVYRTFFPNNLPARSLVTVAGLGPGCLVEVECIAAV